MLPSGPRNHSVGIALFCFQAFSPHAHAIESETILLRPVETTISGTLSPFKLAMDGKKILAEETPVTSLSINGRKIQASATAERPFFLRVRVESISVTTMNSKGKVVRYPAIVLPKITKLTITPPVALFSVTGSAQSIFVNGNDIPIKGGAGTWTPPPDAAILLSPQVAEIRSPGNQPDRFYDWNFKKDTIRRLLTAHPGGLAQLAKIEDEALLGVKPFSFEVAPMYVQQKNGGSTGSIEVGWTPHYFFARNAFINLLLGVAMLQGASDSTFLAINSGVFLSYFLTSRLSLGAGGGAVTWMGNGGTRPTVGGLIAFRLHSRATSFFLDRLFINYSKIFATNSSTVWRVGLGIQF